MKCAHREKAGRLRDTHQKASKNPAIPARRLQSRASRISISHAKKTRSPMETARLPQLICKNLPLMLTHDLPPRPAAMKSAHPTYKRHALPHPRWPIHQAQRKYRLNRRFLSYNHCRRSNQHTANQGLLCMRSALPVGRPWTMSRRTFETNGRAFFGRHCALSWRCPAQTH